MASMPDSRKLNLLKYKLGSIMWVMTSFISLTAIYRPIITSLSYPLVAFLREELRIAVLEDELHLHADGQQYHGHVKDREDAAALVLAFEFRLYLRYLDKEQFLVVGVEGQRVQAVP